MGAWVPNGVGHEQCHDAYIEHGRRLGSQITTLQARVAELEGALDLAGEGAVGAAELLAEVESARSALAEEVEKLRGALNEIASDHCNHYGGHDGKCFICIARAALEPQPQPESEEGATIYVREAERYRKALIVAGWDPQREGVNEWAKRVGMKIDRAGPR